MSTLTSFEHLPIATLTSTATFTSIATPMATSTSISTSSPSSITSIQPQLSHTVPSTSTASHTPIHPILNMLLHGTLSSTSPLRMLRGQTSTLLHIIWQWYLSLTSHWIIDEHAYFRYLLYDVPFPTSHNNIHIINMPIEMGNKDTIPRSLHGYWDMIRTCDPRWRWYGRIAYLTIYEREMQRGDVYECTCKNIHIESPDMMDMKDGGIRSKETMSWMGNEYQMDRMDGGIFMAVNTSDTCALWPCRVADETIIGPRGSLHHLRHHIPVSRLTFRPSTMHWLTSSTPHTFLPLPHDTIFQLFRLILSPIRAWDSRWTSNPLGVAPDVPIVNAET